MYNDSVFFLMQRYKIFKTNASDFDNIFSDVVIFHKQAITVMK